MINICAVSYLNTLPFIYGIKEHFSKKEVNIIESSPSVCAHKIISKDVHIGLIPVVVLSRISSLNIISDYCIGSSGSVDTVCVYSKAPISKVKKIYLDIDSKTSVMLLKVILAEYWKISPSLITVKDSFNFIDKESAALVIGDKAFGLEKKFKYVYDLSLVWYEMTSLPFVFALWVSNCKLSDDFITSFNLALQFGINNIDNALINLNHKIADYNNAKLYLEKRISYEFNHVKKKGLKLFLEKTNKII